jgi:outer membrane protein OmpA-like peptidoglycan-associated protein
MFGSKDANLTPEGRALLDEALPLIEAAAPAGLVVEAHTDDTGDEAANLELSQQQAQVIVDYLVAGGVGRGRLTAVGYGESLPIADNVTEAGRAQNRRIEFTIDEGDG